MAVGLLLLVNVGQGQTLDELSTPNGAKAYIQSFYQQIGQFSIVVVNCSGFVPKDLNGGHFLVAKMWITDSNTGLQFLRGIVIDLDTDWRQAMNGNDYSMFLRTGNKFYLHEKYADLNPDS